MGVMYCAVSVPLGQSGIIATEFRPVTKECARVFLESFTSDSPVFVGSDDINGLQALDHWEGLFVTEVHGAKNEGAALDALCAHYGGEPFEIDSKLLGSMLRPGMPGASSIMGNMRVLTTRLVTPIIVFRKGNDTLIIEPRRRVLVRGGRVQSESMVTLAKLITGCNKVSGSTNIPTVTIKIAKVPWEAVSYVQDDDAEEVSVPNLAIVTRRSPDRVVRCSNAHEIARDCVGAVYRKGSNGLPKSTEVTLMQVS